LYPPHYYSGRPIIMIGDIAKDLSNLCLQPPPTSGAAVAATTIAIEPSDEESLEHRRRRHRGGGAGSKLPPQLAASAGDCRGDNYYYYDNSNKAATSSSTIDPQYRYPGSDDFSIHSMSDVSVDEIFNEVPHMILDGVGIMASASASLAAFSSRGRFAEPNGTGTGRGIYDYSAQSSPSIHHQRMQKSLSIDVDRVDDWIVEPIDLATATATSRDLSNVSKVVKRGTLTIVPTTSSPQPVPQFTETTLEETESQTCPSFCDGAAANPSPSTSGPGPRPRPVLSRFPSQEILYQSEKRPPQPPPPGDFTSAYESLAAASAGATGSSSNNDYSSSTHMQRSAISHPSTLSTNSDWVVFGAENGGAGGAAANAAAAHSDSYSPSPTTRSRRRSSNGHSGMDNEYYNNRQPPPSLSPFEQPLLDDHLGGAHWRHEPPERSESFRRSHSVQQSTPDRDYQHLSYDQEELMLQLQQHHHHQSHRQSHSSRSLLDRGFGVPVQEHFLSTTMAPSPPSPPPPPPPPPPGVQHRQQQQLPPPMPASSFSSSSHATPSSSLLTQGLPPHDAVEIEVSPGEFLPLRGSHETLRAIEAGLGQQVTCMACGALLTCINDCLMVICPDCRCVSQTPNENDRSTVWVRMEDGEPSQALHGDWSGSSGSNNHNIIINNNSSSALQPSHAAGERGEATDWWERGGEEEESESSFLGGFAARHRQEATRRRANVMAISTRPKHGVGLGLKVAER
jgi:hypothetical protein